MMRGAEGANRVPILGLSSKGRNSYKHVEKELYRKELWNLVDGCSEYTVVR